MDGKNDRAIFKISTDQGISVFETTEVLTPKSELGAEDISSLEKFGGAEYAAELRALADRMQRAARPKALYAVLPVESRDADGVTICGVRIASPLMSHNLEGAGRVFPYIATCGEELAALADGLSDPLEVFWADEIMKLFLFKAYAALYERIKTRFDIKNKLAAMNPGSIKEWPLSGQIKLFELLGGGGAVAGAVGVRLTASMLMLPTKSVSGLAFATDTSYENCSRCPLTDCPNRRAKFDPELY